MQRLSSLLFAFFLGLAAGPMASAQDAAAPSRRSSPAPDEDQPAAEETAAPSETPTPPRPEPVKPEAPAPAPPQEPATSQPPAQPAQPPAAMAPPKASTAPASGHRIIREAPVRAVEPRPASARRRPPVADQSDNIGASRPTFDLSNRGNSSISGTIKRLENEWARAIRDHDVKSVSRLIAPDFVGTSSTGRVGSKWTVVSEVRRDKNKYKSADARNMSVHTESDNVGVVTGVARESGVTRDGKRFSNSRRFTDTWVKRNGEWRCIASHTSAISKR